MVNERRINEIRKNVVRIFRFAKYLKKIIGLNDINLSEIRNKERR